MGTIVLTYKLGLSPSSILKKCQPNNGVGQCRLCSSHRGLVMPRPEYDWNYLCDENNTHFIRKNITDRKKKGNIDELISMWKQTNNSTNATTGEMNELHHLASQIPNKTHPDSPIGDEDQNKVVKLI